MSRGARTDSTPRAFRAAPRGGAGAVWMCGGLAWRSRRLGPKHVVRFGPWRKLVGLEIKADSTLRTFRAVHHPSTNRALCRLTSEVERDPVHSTRYGRQRTPGWDFTEGERLPKLKLLSGISRNTSCPQLGRGPQAQRGQDYNKKTQSTSNRNPASVPMV
jgi:hypothetical protein